MKTVGPGPPLAEGTSSAAVQSHSVDAGDVGGRGVPRGSSARDTEQQDGEATSVPGSWPGHEEKQLQGPQWLVTESDLGPRRTSFRGVIHEYSPLQIE